MWSGFDFGLVPYVGWVHCWFSPCFEGFFSFISKFQFDQNRGPTWKLAKAYVASYISTERNLKTVALLRKRKTQTERLNKDVLGLRRLTWITIDEDAQIVLTIFRPRGGGGVTRYIVGWGGAARPLIPRPCLRQLSLIFLPCLRQNSDFWYPV